MQKTIQINNPSQRRVGYGPHGFGGEAAADDPGGLATATMKMLIKAKRIYDAPAAGDGFRILVDRLWPRGVKKENARIALWLKEIAPSDDLRQWFRHEPEKWAEFKRRYFAELRKKQDLVAELRQHARDGAVTLLYSAKDEKHNNAMALLEYLQSQT